ncbi:AsmA family protein [bacterium]|nr:AsmA family protein [bacterium]
MSKFLKITGIILGVILVALYISFLFVVPRVIDITQYKEQIKQIVKEQANLDLDYKNEELITTPILGVGFKADDVTVKLPDKTTIFSSDKIKASVSLPHLLFLTVRVSAIDVQNPLINVEILKNGEEYKIVKHIEDILNTRKEATFGQKPVVEEKEGFQFNPEWIKIIIPNVRLHNYKVLVTDLGTNHYLDLHGEELIFGYFDRKHIRVKTIADLYSDKNKNVSMNIDFDTFLPPPSPELDEEDDPAEKIDIPFVNPVKTYQNYDLKANIDTKIKILKAKKGGLISFGHFNVEDLTLRLSHIQLPKSYFRIKTFGYDADIDANIYTTKDENIQLLGRIFYSKHPSIDMNIKTADIKFQNLLDLGKAFLDSLQIPNELYQYKASGTLLADCYIKTNFRKLKSNGFINIKNGSLSVREINKVLSDVNLNIILDNNILNIVDSGLYVETSPVKISGAIDEKSYTNVDIETKAIPLSKLFNAFAPKNLRNSFNLKSGYLSSSFNIKGKMKEAVAKADLKLNNFDFGDRKNTFDIKNGELNSSFNYDSKTQDFKGNINNSDFKFIFPKTSSVISVPKLGIKIADKNIVIAKNDLLFNNNSVIKYSGQITDYELMQNIDFNAKGSVDTSDLIKFIGNDLRPYLNAKGKLPVELAFNGDFRKKTLFAQALGSSGYYITPVDFDELQGKNTSLQATVVFKPNRIKIKNTGLFTRSLSTDAEGNKQVALGKVFDLDGTLENGRINLMKFDIDRDLSGKIYLFPRSKFTLQKSRIFAFGGMIKPLIRGDININNLIIPEIQTALDNFNIKIGERELTFNMKDLMLKNSDISASGRYSLEPQQNIEIDNLRVNSKLVNVDDLTSVLDSLNRHMPAQKSSSKTSANASADIPVVIPDGRIDFRKIVTGNIELTNTTAQMLLRHNILNLNNLATNIFKGQVNGKVDVDLIKTLINVDLAGQNINIEKALLDAAGMKDALTGTASFTAKLGINGNTKTQAEQIKGINGEINFEAKDGQFGPFGKLENMILAENIRESQFFQTALGGIINKISTIDTAHFTKLKGQLFLKNGVCDIKHITSEGNVMNLHILGKFDVIKNYADMKVRVKITSIISNLLGPLNAINPVNLVNSAASMNVVTAKAFSLFCETVPENEYNVMPQFSNKYVDNSATKFQLGVRGDAAKPLKLIKSFKWLTTKAEIENAQNFVDSIPEQIEGSTATTIEEVIAERKAYEEAQRAALEAEKKTIKYKLKHLFKKED